VTSGSHVDVDVDIYILSRNAEFTYRFINVSENPIVSFFRAFIRKFVIYLLVHTTLQPKINFDMFLKIENMAAKRNVEISQYSKLPAENEGII
jgi:hypothetical protein